QLPYPCLQGVRYSGCVGEACPLDTCWTGAPTPAYLARRRSRWVGAASYLGDTLCHRCRHVVEAAAPPGSGSRSPEQPKAELRAIPRGPSRVVDQSTLTCGRGMWRHTISRPAFASRRIPLKDEVDAATCPAFEASGALHPEVLAYRARHRERVR